jgi:ATP-binding cassette subfamily F protein 3
MLIETRSLSLQRNREPLLRDLSWTLAAGERWALVGANGSGKSSFLSVLAGAPGAAGIMSSGSVRRAPGVWLSVVAQGEGDDRLPTGATLHDLALSACSPLLALADELERRAAELGPESGAGDLDSYGRLQALFQERGGYELAARIAANLNQLGLAAAEATSAAHASGGERRRARLAGALASGAEVLLLDEPTNHLDLANRDALAERLLRHPGGVVFASHDRAWIDRVATHVLLMEGGRARAVRGGYRQAQAQVAEQSEAQLKAARLRRKRAEALAAMAAELRSQGHRGAQVRRKRAERELQEQQRLPSATPPPTPATLVLRSQPEHGTLARFRHLRAEGIIDLESLALRAGERIALVGPSGVGKSTLLRLLAGERPSDDPRSEAWWRPGTALWHVDQHRRGIPDATTPLEALSAWVSDAQARGFLAQVRLPSEAWSRRADALSGGERARAALALLMARAPDVVLLDEPTNDLDLPMIEALEGALQASRATVVVASHDARLIEALGAEVVTLEGGAWVRWRGGLQGWRRGARRLEPDLEGGSAPSPAPAEAPEVDWDGERQRAEEVLLDPLRWGERERERWLLRRRIAEEAIMQLWQAEHPPAEPPYRTREGGWRVWGEPCEGGMRAWLEDHPPGAGVSLRLLSGLSGRVAHLVREATDDRCLTRAAEAALLRGAARLALYHHAVDAVQIASATAPADFEPLASGWWVWRRAAMERSEGWRTGAPSPRRRRRRRALRVG